MGSKRSTVKPYGYQRFVGASAYSLIVIHSETTDAISKSHISPASANAGNDDSDEDKNGNENGGFVEAGAPGSIPGPGPCCY